MVKIIATKVSPNNEGKSFVSLKLQGDPEFVQSQQTGKMYLTAKTCSIASTFDEATANALIGKELPGTVERVSSDPYEYTLSTVPGSSLPIKALAVASSKVEAMLQVLEIGRAHV